MPAITQTASKNNHIAQHALLVKRLAYHMKAKLPPSVEMDDLVQAGMIGLLDAVNRYEETNGAQFETYAVQRIRGAMLDELRSNDWMPRTARQNMRKIEVAISALQQRLGRAPRETEIAKHLKMTLAEYQLMLCEGGGHQLLYYEDFHEGGGHSNFLDRNHMDMSSDPLQSMIDHGFRGAVIEAISRLPKREKQMIGLYYDQEMNLKEIGVVMGVSESRVCQLHGQSVARIRAMLRTQTWVADF
jgi:RNA polymerase sigma factor for flagellar operon FliA